MSDTTAQPWPSPPSPTPSPPPPPPAPFPSATSTPPPPDRESAPAGSANSTPAYVGLVAAAVSIVVGLVVWMASKDALRRTPIDGHHVWTPVATFAAAGATWALVHPGPRRAVRALLGTAAGAAVGAVGGLLIGSTKIHADALRDPVLSGASIGRGAIWALIGAAAWGLTVLAASPRPVASRAAATAAVGGAAIGVAMGILAVTPFGTESPILTDAWFSAWYAIDPKVAHVAPVLIVSVAVPLLLASYAGSARQLRAPLGLAIACCIAIPGIGIAAGHATDIDRVRREDPGSISIADEPAIATAGPVSTVAPIGTDEDSTSAAVPATAPTLDTVPAIPAATEAVPLETVPIETAPVETTPEVVTPPTVATDIDPGFPVVIQHRFSGMNGVGEGFQGQLLIGPAFRNDTAPVAPDGGEICALGANDAVLPFYVEVAPYNASVSQVRITMSQTVLGVADSATYPLSIQFDDLAGPRCAAATDPDIIATAAAVQWDTLGDGEQGGEYGYLVVANYFDDAGNAPGAPSAVLAIAFELNHSASTWTTQTYGTATIDYDQGNGSAGTGFVLTP